MNDIQILKEIAFYSKLIEQQKKHTRQNNVNKYEAKLPSTFNKYKYVKKDQPVIIPVQNDVSTKVLINPNFRQKVLINPHFNTQNRKILVNPKVLNTQIERIVDTVEQIKLPLKAQAQNNPNTSIRSRRLSIRSKYKIVKSSCSSNFVKSLNNSKSSAVRNKYKIDRRNMSSINKSLFKKKVITRGISDILRNKVFTNKTWKKTVIISQFKLRNYNNIPSKQPQTKLKKTQSTSNRKKSLIVIKGQKYAVAMNKKSLKRLSSFSKSNKSLKKHLKVSPKSTKNKYKLINTRKHKNQSNKLRKNNIPCPVYQRYGKCRRKELSRCYFLHNPNQIFLCKKFLQGACLDKDCLLSHKVSAEKMPTCKYFLEGCCIKNDCPFLHVKINPKADICRKFLEGFCEKGSQCNLRHQFLCPNFEKNGVCSKRKCIYPHRNKTETDKPKTKVWVEKNEEKTAEEPKESKRYYADQVNMNNRINNDLFSDIDGERPSRPQLGVLPSFIPFS